MTSRTAPPASPPSASPNTRTTTPTRRVVDATTCMLHWLMALCFTGAYLTADDLTFSHDTLQDFATASEAYAECSKPRFEQVGGYSALFLDGAQVRKGDRRIDVIVIDFGTVRAIAK